MPAGRPTKLTRELFNAFIDALRRTYYVETAADLIGLHRDTMRIWLKRGARANGDKKDRIYKEFSGAVKSTLADKESANLTVVEGAGQWQSRAWLLERRSPERWGADKGAIKALEKQIADLAKLVESSVRSAPTSPSPNQSNPSPPDPDADDGTD